MFWAVLRSPRRSNIFALAFFTVLAVVISLTWLQPLFGPVFGRVSSAFTAALVLLIPYLLLRLTGEYFSISSVARRLSELGLIGAVALVTLVGTDFLPVLAVILAYFSVVAVYAARRFAVAAETANGISRMRFKAISRATTLLGAALLSVIATEVVGGWISASIEVLRQLTLMASALLFFAGFSPPVTLRRAWQEPELRRFLDQIRDVPRYRDFNAIIRHLEHICSETTGAPHATIGLWNEETGHIEFKSYNVLPGQTIGGKSFQQKRPILSLDTVSDDPESRDIYELGNAWAVMAAPINTDSGTIGVLALYAEHPPIFAEDDLSLLTSLADQIGIVLENRSHIQAQAELEAREASARLKDEFLHHAAHDLKTPLTTILATAQYLERRLEKHGTDSPEMRSITRLNREAVRLRKLVEGLLDASRIEQGQVITNIEHADVSALVSDVVRHIAAEETHRFKLDIHEGISADCDTLRFQQVVENLLENARKYSEKGSTITVSLWHEGGDVILDVADEGMGISRDDQAKVFDRYFRSESVEHRSVQGIGLGLFMCKAIAEQHGGTIDVKSEVGEGSVFRVTIPRKANAEWTDQQSDALASEPHLQEHMDKGRPVNHF